MLYFRPTGLLTAESAVAVVTHLAQAHRPSKLLAGVSAIALLTGLTLAVPARAVDKSADPFLLGGINDSVLDAVVIPGATTIGDIDLDTGALISDLTDILNPPLLIHLDRFPFTGELEFANLTRNESAVGNALADIYALGAGEGGYGPDFAALFDYLSKLGAGDQGLVRGIFEELGGAVHVQLQQTTLGLVAPFSMVLGQRLDALKLGMAGFDTAQIHQYAQAAAIMSDASPNVTQVGSGVSLWARGYGQWAQVDGDANAPGYDQSTGGAAAGIDFRVGASGILGVAVGWSNTDVDFNTPGDDADVDSFQIGGYGTYGFGRFYLDAQVIGAFHDLSTRRVLNLPNPPGGMVAGANYDARTYLASAELGAVWREGDWMFQPHVGLLFAHVDSDAFIESGAGDFNLIVKDTSSESVASTVGLRVATKLQVGRTTIIPEVSAAWRHDFDDDRQTFTAAFPADPTATFRVVSSKVSQDSALLGAGLTAAVAKDVDVFVNYNALLNPDVDVHNISAGVRVTW